MVARFVRDEEAVGSNPATPTGNRRDRLVPAIFYRSALLGLTGYRGYRTRVIGHYVLLEGRLFGLLVRESRCFSWLGPTWRMDKSWG